MNSLVRQSRPGELNFSEVSSETARAKDVGGRTNFLLSYSPFLRPRNPLCSAGQSTTRVRLTLEHLAAGPEGVESLAPLWTDSGYRERECSRQRKSFREALS